MSSRSDELREERIAVLAQLVREAQAAGDKAETRRLYDEYKAAALARSPEQVALLEAELHQRIFGGDR